MSADDFFSRWAKKNQQAHEARADQPAAAPEPEPDPWEGRTPTQEDLDKLSPQDNISAFMKQGVDENVKRSALKKLFSDPHFNIMDGLDIYIDDYSKPDPIPPEMMAMLQHAKGLLEPEGLKEQPVMAMRGKPELANGDRSLDDASAESAAGQDESAPAQPGDPSQPDLQNPQARATEQEEQQDPAPAAPGAAANDTSGTNPERETPKP